MLGDVLAACPSRARSLHRDRRATGEACQGSREATKSPSDWTRGARVIVNADLPCGAALVNRAVGRTDSPSSRPPTGRRTRSSLSDPGPQPLYGPGSAERFRAAAPSRTVAIENLVDDVDTLAISPGSPDGSGRAPERRLRREVVVLAGGFGGARFARALAETDAELTVIGNVGDDEEILGLHISPDLDSILYTLAGLGDEERGWGSADETWNALETVKQLGGEAGSSSATSI